MVLTPKNLGGSPFSFYPRIPEATDCKGLSDILSHVKIPLLPNPHLLQVNPRIGFPLHI